MAKIIGLKWLEKSGELYTEGQIYKVLDCRIIPNHPQYKWTLLVETNYKGDARNWSVPYAPWEIIYQTPKDSLEKEIFELQEIGYRNG